MPYTIWSNNVLVGHSDLGFVECIPKLKVGWFHATPEGEPLVAILNDPRLVLLHAHDAEDSQAVEEAFETSCARAQAIPLELRGDNDAVIATEDIAIQDMDITQQYGDLADAREMYRETPTEEMLGIEPVEEFDMSEEGIFDADWDVDLGLEPEVEWPKYQLMVRLAGYDAAMSAS